MGSSAEQRLECLVCRQGSKSGHCFDFPGEFRGSLGRIQQREDREPSPVSLVCIEKALRAPEGEVREQSHTPGSQSTTASSFHVLFCVRTTQDASAFPSIIIKGLLMWLLHTWCRKYRREGPQWDSL